MKFDEPIRDQWKKRRRDCFRKLASEILDWLKEEDPEILRPGGDVSEGYVRSIGGCCFPHCFGGRGEGFLTIA